MSLRDSNHFAKSVGLTAFIGEANVRLRLIEFLIGNRFRHPIQDFYRLCEF